MAKELREAYMDDKEIPPSVKRFVDKHDPNSGRNLSSAMNKATKALDKARDNLVKLQNASSKHRTHWMTHLKSLMETLSKQAEAFEKQQKDYQQKITSLQRDVQVARRDLQKLSAQAAASATDTRELPAEEEVKIEPFHDAEEEDMRTKVHDLLAACLKPADKAFAVEIDSGDESMEGSTERQSKRPRSLEPFPK